jgi:lipopolysaccharide export system protein LptA
MMRALTLLLFMATASVWAQNRITLKQADQLRGGRRGEERFDRVIGNVVFVQNRTTIYCDSALFFRSANRVEAYGNVRITDGDSVTITAVRGEYDGNNRLAKLRQRVVFTKLKTATLYTDYLDFDRERNEARYFNGGKLVDSINVLTSRKGYYDLNNNMASFKRDVVVTNPDYTMTSDSLQYNSSTKIIYFRTATTVTDKDNNKAIYEGGEYDTRTRQSALARGMAETQSYSVKGDRIFLDDLRRFYRVRGNVVMVSKEENLTIYGDESVLDRRNNLSKVYGNAWLAKVVEEGDTLFLSADTLVNIDHPEADKKRLLAYHHVKIWKTDMQGIADSVEYRQADSMLYFYRSPVLWTQGNQMLADTIAMLIERGQISKVYLTSNSFVVSVDTLKNYNQMKGRRMTAHFRDQQLSHVVVDGNGESLFFALDDKTNAFIGMNKIICSNITIRFKDGVADNVTFYVKPEAEFIPPHELVKEKTRLKGFVWLGDTRPGRADVVKQNNRAP